MARTKEELKALIEKMTYENTSHALEQEILLEMLEQMGGVTIDLSDYELSEAEIDVTAAFPEGYRPKAGDTLLWDGYIHSLVSSVDGDDVTRAFYGYMSPNGDYSGVDVAKYAEDSKWMAMLKEN